MPSLVCHHPQLPHKPVVTADPQGWAYISTTEYSPRPLDQFLSRTGWCHGLALCQPCANTHWHMLCGLPLPGSPLTHTLTHTRFVCAGGSQAMPPNPAQVFYVGGCGCLDLSETCPLVSPLQTTWSQFPHLPVSTLPPATYSSIPCHLMPTSPLPHISKID